MNSLPSFLLRPQICSPVLFDVSPGILAILQTPEMDEPVPVKQMITVLQSVCSEI